MANRTENLWDHSNLELVTLVSAVNESAQVASEAQAKVRSELTEGDVKFRVDLAVQAERNMCPTKEDGSDALATIEAWICEEVA